MNSHNPQRYPRQSFKIYTLGCKVNQYDSQEIRERLLESGWHEAGKARAAGVYIVNTCTVTQKADKDSLYYIHRCFRENPKASIIVTGCLAETDAQRLAGEQGVSRVVKNKDKRTIASFMTSCRLPDHCGISFFEGRTRAFLKIQDGCNNFCSYCKVPLARGISRSKPLARIMDEARQLVSNGYREIVLTGICLGSYGEDMKPRCSLTSVIERLAQIDGLWRIRLSSIEAKDVTDDLIRSMADSTTLCRHMHIPIQSGDNDILRAMRRKYTQRDYISLINKLNRACPGIAITTDVLVGFPGEEERHFRNTLHLVQEIMPLKTHIFPFSPREGTAAYNIGQRIPAEIVRDRIERLHAIACQCAGAFQKKFIAAKMPVLFETRCKDAPGSWEGYTDNYLKVRFRSRKNLKNRLMTLRLQRFAQDKIIGVLP